MGDLVAGVSCFCLVCAGGLVLPSLGVGMGFLGRGGPGAAGSCVAVPLCLPGCLLLVRG